MKSVPYSPFNRTYKYLCLQNQLAHNKNKGKVKGLVDSNLTVMNNNNLGKTAKSSQPWANFILSTHSLSGTLEGRLKQNPLVIHKNSKYNARVEHERKV